MKNRVDNDYSEVQLRAYRNIENDIVVNVKVFPKIEYSEVNDKGAEIPEILDEIFFQNYDIPFVAYNAIASHERNRIKSLIKKQLYDILQVPLDASGAREIYRLMYNIETIGPEQI